ncbi:MAG: isoprenylcysteine carboxylmethyltransferase family protein [Bacteroidales bacterium]|nr:isoprenylcysteine carboxylmethyltransferase family protein [Bacteroidales bacterium]
MKYLIFLSYIFFISEFLLMLVKRSKKSTSKHQKDKGSLVLLWVTISICFTFGFIFADYSRWNLSHLIMAVIGLLIIIVGLIIRWVAILQLKKAFTVDVAIGTEQKLKTDGMYKTIRHPSYLGMLMIMIGFAISMNSIMSILVIVIPMIIVLLFRISVEETLLLEAFGNQYIEFRSKTKKLIPWLY